MTHSRRRWSIETEPEMTGMMELVAQNFKFILSILKNLKEVNIKK